MPALAALNATAGGNTITLGPDVMTIDTIYHAKVGPGTTQTQLHLTGGPNLNVFYLTVDISTPGVSMRTVCPGGRIAGNARTSAMAEANSNANTLYFAGTNGDFYYTSGKATDGSSLVGTPTYGAIVDGEVYKSSGAGYQFTVDAAGIPRVCRISFHNGTATKGDASVPFRGINVDAPNNALTLYTPRGWTSPCQGAYAGNCAEVYARLVEGDSFVAGRSFRVEVTSNPTSTGDLPVPADGCVLLARGSARAFVDGLQPGDIVTLDNVITTPEGERIYPTQCVSGNPKNVLLGANAQSEAERGDASDRHPRTGIGYSQDGTKVIMMVVDGRGVSKGVTTGMLGDLLIYAGAYEGVNLDGGGSSTLYTAALGVRNHCSDGNERPVGNAIFATVDGNVTDREVAEVQFVDWHKSMPQMAVYTPQVYAFNAAGVLIDTDFRDYTLTCAPELGTITADGKSLIATGEGGCHALTVTYGNATPASIAVDIAPAEISLRLDRVILQPGATYPIQLVATTTTGPVPVSAAAFTWESSDVAIVTVDDNGVATGVANGTATITGRRGDATVVLAVDVQTPDADIIPVESDLAGWTMKKTLMGTTEMAILENGLVIDYTMGSNARGAKMTLNARKELPARPKALRIRMTDATVIPTSFAVTFKAANEAKNTVVTNSEIGTSAQWTWKLPLSEYYDLDDPATYPIEFVSLVISPADAAKATGHIELPGIEVVYPEGASGIEEVTVDDAVAAGDAVWYNLAGVRVNPDSLVPGIYIRRTGATSVKVAVR